MALVRLVAEDAISSKQGKEVFAAVLEEGKDPADVVKERGMEQVLSLIHISMMASSDRAHRTLSRQ